jgi:NADH-quinone oxidoreductase subunit N
MNLGAFGIISIIEGEGDTNLTISSYNGLSSRKPVLSALLALFMFSLAGIPPFAGFFGKYYIFIAAIKADLNWLAIIGVISSAISVYFYLRIVVYMYFRDSEEKFAISDSKTGLTAVILSSILVILLGLFPGTILQLISSFV